MADTYRIVARIVAEDATTAGVTAAEKRLSALEDRARGVGSSISQSLNRAFNTVGSGSAQTRRQLQNVEQDGQRVGTNLAGWFGRAFAVLGGGAAVGGIARSLIGVNSELQQAQSSLAGLFTAQTGMPIAQSLQVARGALAGLRKDAAGGVGELSDYLETFQMAAGLGIGQGASIDQLRQLTRNAIAAGEIVKPGIGMKQAGLDVSQALSGQVSERTTPIVMAALRAAGMSEDKFRKLKPEERVNALNKAFATFAPAVELMGKSWSAQFDTLKDNVRGLFQLVTKPLFERWSGYLRDANDWLDRNRGNLTEIVETWGARLVRVWDTLIRQAKTYAVIVAGTALVQYAAPVGRGLSTAGGALARGGSVVGAALRDPFGMSGMFANALGGPAGSAGIGGLLSTAWTGLRGLLGVLGRAAGPIAVVTTALLALKGGFEEYPGVLLFIKDQASALWATLGRLGDALGSLTGKGSLLNMVGASLGVTFGGVIWVVDKVVIALGSLAIGLGVVLQIIGQGLKMVYDMATGNGSAWANGTDQMALSLVNAQDQLSKLWFGDTNSGVQGEQTAPDGKLGKLPPVANNVTNINGPVTLQVKTEINADPARVMAALDEGVDKLRLFRKQAKRLPALGV